MKRALLACILVLTCLSVFGEPATIETPSFRLSFPGGWSKGKGATPIRVTGPDGTVVLLSSHSVAAGSSDKETTEALSSVESATKEAFAETVKNSGLVVQMPWRKKPGPSGGTILDTLATSADSRSYLGGIVVTGRRCVITATVEGNAAAVQQFAVAREVLAGVVWK